MDQSFVAASHPTTTCMVTEMNTSLLILAMIATSMWRSLSTTKYLVHERHSSIIDSEASHSTVCHFIKLRNPSRQQHSIELAFGRTHTEWEGQHGDIPNTIYLPNCTCDIYSVSSLNKLGYEILFNSDNVYARNPTQGMDSFERIGVVYPRLGFV
jgi:hypothetical protein